MPPTGGANRKADTTLATVATDQALIEAVIAEMSDGIECAVGFWIEQVEHSLGDPHLTTLGRLNMVREIVKQYRLTTEGSRANVDGYVA
jgi:hypothetical protein